MTTLRGRPGGGAGGREKVKKEITPSWSHPDQEVELALPSAKKIKTRGPWKMKFPLQTVIHNAEQTDAVFSVVCKIIHASAASEAVWPPSAYDALLFLVCGEMRLGCCQITLAVYWLSLAGLHGYWLGKKLLTGSSTVYTSPLLW